MKVITLAKTKELLGIKDGSQDTAISAKIPFIDATVKQITNNRFNLMIIGDATIDSPYIPVSSVVTATNTNYVVLDKSKRQNGSGINNPYIIDDLNEYLEIGQLVQGTGIPADTHITEIFYNGDVSVDGDTFCIPTIQLSANITETTAGLRIYLGISIAYQTTIAKGIQFLINGTSTSLPSNSLASRTIGPSSKSFAGKDQEIDGRYGLPAWFVKAFPQFQGGH